MEHHVIHYVALIVLKLIKELIYRVNSCGIEYLIKHEVTHALIEHKKIQALKFSHLLKLNINWEKARQYNEYHTQSDIIHAFI